MYVKPGRTYPSLPESLREQLKAIASTKDEFGLEYFPVRANLSDGRVLDRVYIVEAEKFLQVWGIAPEHDRGKSALRIEDIAAVDESPCRLPPEIANKIYKAGESGMGYTVFTLFFSDGSKQAYLTGNAVDFVAYPPGKTLRDVVEVKPHAGRHDSPVNGPNYYWALFSTLRPSSSQ